MPKGKKKNSKNKALEIKKYKMTDEEKQRGRINITILVVFALIAISTYLRNA